MLCKTVQKPFDNDDWAFEIKWDGYRAIADLSSHNQQFYSRNGIDFSEKFRIIAQSLSLQKHKMILDGEIVAYDHTGKPSFQMLQSIGEHSDTALIYQVFDLLWLNGYSTENLPYLQRKELLKEALFETEYIRYHDHVIGKGTEFFRAAKAIELEGIVAKKTDSLYHENLRSPQWLKIKNHQSDEAIICGFTAPKGARKYFGSLILGKYLNGKIIFCGHAGTGFSVLQQKEIFTRLKTCITQKPPFEKIPATNAAPTWLLPDLVCEIKYTGLTKDFMYRHPVFMRIREDIIPENVSFDHHPNTTSTMKKITNQNESRISDKETKINKERLILTHPDKMYFPEDGIKKGDVIDYYQKISEYILPHLQNRAQSMNRFPDGIDGFNFYQKDAPEHIPDWIPLEKIFSETNQKDIRYIVCNNAETLAFLNNLGCIELNIWTSRIQNLDKPDYLVLDLDPSGKNTFDDVIETALAVKEILDKAQIKGYPKTSGKTGLHIYIPMGAAYHFEQVKNFAHLIMTLVNERLPDLTTLERSLEKREKTKIYLDYLQNRFGQTLASVYSIRPKNGAPVSMPLEWEEVKKGLSPLDFTIFNAGKRLKSKGDLFAPVLGKGIDMIKAIENLGEST